MSTTRRLWIALGLLLGATFAVLLWMGRDIHRSAPPLPDKVMTANGRILFTRADLDAGRQVWQSFGGQQLGSVWGHGVLVAPDWSADWLHRESVALLDLWARRDHGAFFADLADPEQDALKARLRRELRSNTFDARNDTISVSEDRALAISNVAAHYISLFSNDPATQKLREGYAMRNSTVPDLRHREQLAGFFFWTRWAASTNRPDSNVSYTSNWPYEPFVGNSPTPGSVLQLSAALENGYWYARSAEFMGRPIIHLLVWMRVPGDTIFAIGALLFAWFVLRLWIAPKRAAVEHGSGGGQIPAHATMAARRAQVNSPLPHRNPPDAQRVRRVVFRGAESDGDPIPGRGVPT